MNEGTLYTFTVTNNVKNPEKTALGRDQSWSFTTIGKNAQFEGIIPSMNEITLEKSVKLKGRKFSQTSITLDDNIITEPGSIAGQTSSTNR